MTRSPPLPLILLLVAGCTPTPADDNTTATDDDDAPAPWTGGTPSGAGDPWVAFELEAEVSEVVTTVVTVRFSVDVSEVDAARIEFGPTGDCGRTANALPTGDGGYEAVLLGLKPATEVFLRAAVDVHERTSRSALVSATTGDLPVDLPEIDLAAQDPDAALDGYLLTSIVSAPSWPVVLDADGDVVWWHRVDATWTPSFIPRLRLGADGRTFVYLATPEPVEEDDPKHNVLVRVSADGIDQEIVDVEHAHHDFVVLDDGALGLVENDTREVDGEPVDGDRIVELAPDGTRHEVFTVWDHLQYEPYEGPIPMVGWTHANAIDLVGDIYYLSLHNLDAIVAVDRDTGDLLAQAGGEGGDYALPDGSTHLFDWQHQFQVLDDGLLVFDNGPFLAPESRLVEYALVDGAAEVVWDHRADPALYVYVLGDVTRLPDDTTLATWSSAGRIEQVDPTGATLLQLDLPLGAGFGYTEWVDDLP